MEIRFDGQVALVTGASTGIGAAIARAFGQAGANVVVHYNQSEEEARAVCRDIEAAGGKALIVQADVSDPAQVDRVVDATMKTFGRIDILVNNAGALVQRSPVEAMEDEVYERILKLNLDSVFHFCKRVTPIMRQQGRGNIINMTSIAARTGGGNGSVIYATSKGAVSTFTRGLAKELAPANIRVNAIAPGVILTPFHERYSTPEMIAQMVETIPMKRAGTAEECVGAALFLASDALSGYVTGQIIEVNGGQFMP
ncbi:MAG: SDR family NAD(P)-dependent oxidoreductase [Chloroflexota bacterium]|nr:MAG: oxidoreductase [Chloroflexota bacterium]